MEIGGGSGRWSSGGSRSDRNKMRCGEVGEGVVEEISDIGVEVGGNHRLREQGRLGPGQYGRPTKRQGCK